MEPVAGSCLCGGVRFELTLPFRRAGWCHCSRCRKHSGGIGLPQGRVPRDGFRLLAGAELLRVFRAEDAAAAKVFCATCGSSLFGGDWPGGDDVSVRLGALDGEPSPPPQDHAFSASLPSWLVLPDDGLPRHAGPRPAA